MLFEAAMSKFTLADLEQRISDRAKAPAEESYTRKLLDKGVAHCAKKFGEEAVETVLAAVGEDRERADRAKPPTCSTICWSCCRRAASRSPRSRQLLATRTKQSGLEEKASRKGG